MKRAVLISCSDHYGHRLRLFDRVLREQGFETTYVTSDFDHTAKQVYVCGVPGCVQLHVPPYHKNLSVARIVSHRTFARSVFRYLEALPREPAVVLALLPPNYLGSYLARYKRRHPQVLLQFDIFDLWPESFPSARLKGILRFPFAIWASLRDRSLGNADYISAECRMFCERLALPAENALYFSLPACGAALTPPPSDRLVLGYLGAINNLIDIPRIAVLLAALCKIMPVTLHIIGDGESRTAFCAAAQEAGAEVYFHGKIFDGAEKDRILGLCHFGLNVMKDSVCVGLTMKSVDYLRHALPLVNSIGSDTEALIRSRGIGIQLAEPEETAAQLAAAVQSGTADMRRAALQTYQDCFSEDAALRACRAATARLLRQEDLDGTR